jgi:outer membrane receptor protein involved in Fe transport
LSGRTSYNLKKNLTLFARGENLLNKKYIVPAEQALGNFVGVPGRGRYLEVGVTWDFGK